MASESSICPYCGSCNLRSANTLQWRCADCGKKPLKVRSNGKRPHQHGGFQLLESDYEVNDDGCWLWKWSKSRG